MTTKQWLTRASHLDGMIYTAMETRDKERQKLLRIVQKLDGDPVQSTRDPHKYDRLVELNEKIDALIDAQLAIEAEIVEAIGQLEKPLYQRILWLKYLDGMTFPAIAEVVRLSQRHVERLHGKALAELGGIIGIGRVQLHEQSDQT